MKEHCVKLLWFNTPSPQWSPNTLYTFFSLLIDLLCPFVSIRASPAASFVLLRRALCPGPRAGVGLSRAGGRLDPRMAGALPMACPRSCAGLCERLTKAPSVSIALKGVRQNRQDAVPTNGATNRGSGVAFPGLRCLKCQMYFGLLT